MPGLRQALQASSAAASNMLPTCIGQAGCGGKACGSCMVAASRAERTAQCVVRCRTDRMSLHSPA